MAYTIKLKDRGNSVIRCIDLFDECQYGADKLFFRGNFETPQDVAKQVIVALGGEGLDTDKLQEIYGVEITDEFIATKLGIGNPLTPEDENGIQTIPTIALNRFNIPNKKFWNDTPPSDIANPHKASAAVTFSLRLYFRDDYAYITFGCPWSEIMDESKDEDITVEEGTDLIRHFKLLQCHFISKEDAIIVLKELGLNVPMWDKNIQTPEATQHLLDLVDEDGSVISL